MPEPPRATGSAVDEQAFLLRLISRDEAAFGELVRAYESRIFGLLYRMVGNRAEAEDLAQEVFVQVFKSIEQFRGDSKIGTWMYRIAVNLCKNRQEYVARRRPQTSAARGRESQHTIRTHAGVARDEVARPDELLEERQLERMVQTSLQALEPEFREALILRDVEDLPYDEIALIAGVAEGTVKSRIHRARSQLRLLIREASSREEPGR